MSYKTEQAGELFQIKGGRRGKYNVCSCLHPVVEGKQCQKGHSHVAKLAKVKQTIIFDNFAELNSLRLMTKLLLSKKTIIFLRKCTQNHLRVKNHDVCNLFSNVQEKEKLAFAYKERKQDKILMIDAAAAAAESLQSCLTLCDPIDSSPPGSPVPGILQERTLEWVAISFSNE